VQGKLCGKKSSASSRKVLTLHNERDTHVNLFFKEEKPRCHCDPEVLFLIYLLFLALVFISVHYLIFVI